MERQSCPYGVHLQGHTEVWHAEIRYNTRVSYTSTSMQQATDMYLMKDVSGDEMLELSLEEK